MKIILSAFLLLVSLSAGAQHTIGELFKVMPDSLMPLLTKNNRLDMIDFLDAKMNAIVRNKLDGESEMTRLTADSLTVKMSNSQTVHLFLVPTPVAYDSCQQVICMETTYRLPSSGQTETVAHYFSVLWNRLDDSSFADIHRNKSTILKQDDALFEKNPMPF